MISNHPQHINCNIDICSWTKKNKRKYIGSHVDFTTHKKKPQRKPVEHFLINEVSADCSIPSITKSIGAWNKWHRHKIQLENWSKIIAEKLQFHCPNLLIFYNFFENIIYEKRKKKRQKRTANFGEYLPQSLVGWHLTISVCPFHYSSRRRNIVLFPFYREPLALVDRVLETGPSWILFDRRFDWRRHRRDQLRLSTFFHTHPNTETMISF